MLFCVPAAAITQWRYKIIVSAKLPRRLIYDTDSGDKRILLYMFLYFRKSMIGQIAFTLDDAVISCGYKPCRSVGRINDEFAELIHRFKNSGYISINQVNHSAQMIATALPSFEQPRSFGMIYYEEFSRIINFRKMSKEKTGRKINQAHLLLVLSYIRLNMHKRTSIHDKQPEMFFSYIQTMANNTGLSERCISSSLSILEELNIIHSEELPRYYDKEYHWHSNVRIFVNMERYTLEGTDSNYDWHKENDRGILYILSSQEHYPGGNYED